MIFIDFFMIFTGFIRFLNKKGRFHLEKSWGFDPHNNQKKREKSSKWHKKWLKMAQKWLKMIQNDTKWNKKDYYNYLVFTSD